MFGCCIHYQGQPIHGGMPTLKLSLDRCRCVYNLKHRPRNTRLASRSTHTTYELRTPPTHAVHFGSDECARTGAHSSKQTCITLIAHKKQFAIMDVILQSLFRKAENGQLKSSLPKSYIVNMVHKLHISCFLFETAILPKLCFSARPPVKRKG